MGFSLMFNYLFFNVNGRATSKFNELWKRFLKVFKTSALFASITYLSTATSIVQFSVITTLLSRDELGVYGVWMAVAMLTSAISAWGVVPVGIRLAAHNGNAQGVAVQGALCSICLSGVLITVALLLDRLFAITKHEPLWLCLACIGASLISVREILFIPLHNRQSFKTIGLIRFANALLVAIVSVMLVVSNPLAMNLVIASLIVNAGIVLFLLYYLYKGQTFKILFFDGYGTVKKIFQDGSTITVINLSGTMFNRLDWLVLGAMTTQYVVGGYSVIYRLYEFSYQLTAPFTTMLYPKFCQGDSSWSTRLWQLRTKIFFGGATIAIVAICAFPIITDFFWPGKFSDQFIPFVILMSGLPCIFMVGFMYQYYMSQGMQTYLLRISLFSMVLNAVLLFVLVPKFGSTGAAVATLIPQLIQYQHMASNLRKRANQ